MHHDQASKRAKIEPQGIEGVVNAVVAHMKKKFPSLEGWDGDTMKRCGLRDALVAQDVYGLETLTPRALDRLTQDERVTAGAGEALKALAPSHRGSVTLTSCYHWIGQTHANCQ